MVIARQPFIENRYPSLIAELSRALASQRSTIGKKTIHPRKFSCDVAQERRPSVHPLHVSRCQMSGYFGGKAYGHPRPAKLNEKKSYSEEEKNKGDIFC